MKIIKKYTVIQISSKIDKNNDILNVNLKYGSIEGSYYNQIYPKEEFDTEDEAIKYSYDTNKYINWLIVPIISFED